MKNSLVNSSLLANLSEANAKNLETIVSLIADLLVCLSTPEDTRSVLFDSCYASCNVIFASSNSVPMSLLLLAVIAVCIAKLDWN